MSLAPSLRRALNGCAVLALLGVLGLGALVAFLWLEGRSHVSLPRPSGPFAVGREIEDWVDSASVDALSPTPGTKRELLIWIWYPAMPGQSPAVDDYLPVRLRPKAEPADRGNIWTWLTRDVTRVRGHGLRDAEVAPQARAYPVVVLRAGASSEVVNYSSLAEDLASHGYVVVGFDAPYRTRRVVFPDGRVIYRDQKNNPERCVLPDRVQTEQCVDRVMESWSGDIGFVLDRLARLGDSRASSAFAGRLDMTRVGLLGHSLGGAVSAQFCHDDVRCKAVIDIDGAPHGSVVQEGLQRPVMFLLSDHSKEPESATAPVMADIASVYDRVPPDRRLRVVIRGAFHYMFSDDGALLKSSVVRGLLRVSGRLRMSGRRQLAVTSYCVRTFFDHYLKNPTDSPVTLVSPLYPEIVVLK